MMILYKKIEKILPKPYDILNLFNYSLYSNLYQKRRIH